TTDRCIRLRGTVTGAGLELRAVRVTDAEGRDTTSAGVGEVLHVDALVRAREAVAAPEGGLALFDRLGTLVFAGGGSGRPVRPAARGRCRPSAPASSWRSA